MSSFNGGPNDPVAPDATQKLAMLEAWLAEKDQTDMQYAHRLESVFGQVIALSDTNTARLNERIDYLANAVSQLTSEVFKLARATETLGGEVAGLKNCLHQADSVQVQSQRPTEYATAPSAKRTSSAMQEGSRKRNMTSPADLSQSRKTYPRESGSIRAHAVWDSSTALRTPRLKEIHSRGDGSSSNPGTNKASAAPETPQFDRSCTNSQDVVSEPGVTHPSDAAEMVGSRQTSKAPFVWPERLTEPEFGPFGEPYGSFPLNDGPVAASKPLIPPSHMLPPSVVYCKPVVYHRPSPVVKLSSSVAGALRLVLDEPSRQQ